MLPYPNYWYVRGGRLNNLKFINLEVISKWVLVFVQLYCEITILDLLLMERTRFTGLKQHLKLQTCSSIKQGGQLTVVQSEFPK